MRGFRYVLELPDGEPGDPMIFNSAPPEAWRPSDEFLAAKDLRRFRVLAIDDEAPGVLAEKQTTAS
jgi:hypothetical protein